ncbi:hypothetical protein Sango_2487100 [Sesamum angolense]|uniref:Reverse transcriptase zinc-binding domain-containing protein n=1 Tax=Sesamum angolense TaxID=2727404 RepID=A0AAE2BI30_9LAMI|nr:hypothetical protein Sango_2487100 [Sesamum angolense]
MLHFLGSYKQPLTWCSMIQAAVWNVRGLNRGDHQQAVNMLVNEFHLHFIVQGARFTSHNCSDGGRSLWKRLDRALVIEEWLNKWPNTTILSTTRRTFDHSAFVLQGSTVQREATMFRFDNYLARSHGFLSKVVNVWQNNIYGTMMYSVTRKLKLLESVFRQMRKEKERVCKLVVAKATKLEQNMLQQWSKLQWLKGGDQCTRLFFRKVVVQLDHLRPWTRHLVTQEGIAMLQPVSRDEIKTAFFDIAEDKAPGPDGYSSRFFKAAWPIVGEEIIKAIMEFFHSGKILKLNATLITLIPKMHKNIMESSVFQFHWRCRELELFSLCFADDLLLFCRVDVASVLVFKEVLDWFSGVFGLQANPDKSQLILSKSAEHLRPCLHQVLGFQEGVLPLKYLGLPLVHSRLTIQDCQPLLLKVDKHIAGWTGIPLSFAGRVQLIKTVLSALHTYWSASFVLPKGVIKFIEKKMRKFLWQGTSDHGYAKVAWSQVCLPYDEGGQGIRAITPRHLWDVLQHSPQSIWVQWIWQYKIRSKSVWTVSVTSGSWSWRKMIKLRHLLLNDIRYEVGTMNHFTVWHDPWHPRGVLIHKFPRGLSVIGVPLDARLDVVMHDEQWHWPPITNLEMLDITDNLPPIHSGPSRIRWNSSSGTLTNSDALHLFQPKGPKVGWSSLFLGPFSIARNLFILWLAILERLSTLDKAWCRMDNQDCSLCDTGEMETHSQLFFDCAYVRHCLSIIRRETQIQWPYTSRQRGIHWACKRWRRRHLVNAAYRATLASLVYHLWRERNLRRFQNSRTEVEVVAELVLEQIRSRIFSDELKFNLQTSVLYRL